VLPANYQYPLSAAIYKIISSADAGYSQFLHDVGYSGSRAHKRFKLFCFSSLQAPYRMEGDRMVIKQPDIRLTMGFLIPEAAEKFVIGLFRAQVIDIADQKSKAQFLITRVDTLPPLPPTPQGGLAEAVMEPLSPVACGPKNASGHYIFLPPDHPEFLYWLQQNLAEKLASAGIALQTMPIWEVLTPTTYKSRLITIKAGTPAETRIRGFMQFRLRTTATNPVLQTILEAGLGLYNAQGMGCMDLLHYQHLPNATTP
jgi:CRISPR-associated endoribonuclease Cas6